MSKMEKRLSRMNLLADDSEIKGLIMTIAIIVEAEFHQGEMGRMASFSFVGESNKLIYQLISGATEGN